MCGGCWCAGVTHTLGIAVHSVSHLLSGRRSRSRSRSLLTPQRGAVAAAGGSAAPGTERNEWGRNARSEVPAQPLEVALRSREPSSRRRDRVESCERK